MPTFAQHELQDIEHDLPLREDEGARVLRRKVGIGFWVLGFGVWGLGFGVWGLGFGVWGLR